MAARITATPQGTGEGTPKIQKPRVARKPWARGTTTIACKHALHGLAQVVEDLGFLGLGEGRDVPKLGPQAPSVAQQEEQHEEEQGELEDRGGEAGDESLDERARGARELGEAEGDERHELVLTPREPAPQHGDALGQRLLQDLLERLRLQVRRHPVEEGDGLGAEHEEGGEHGDEDRRGRDQHQDRGREARAPAERLPQPVLDGGQEKGHRGGDREGQEKRPEDPEREDEDHDQRAQQGSEDVARAALGHGRY